MFLWNNTHSSYLFILYLFCVVRMSKISDKFDKILLNYSNVVFYFWVHFLHCLFCLFSAIVVITGEHKRAHFSAYRRNETFSIWSIQAGNPQLLKSMPIKWTKASDMCIYRLYIFMSQRTNLPPPYTCIIVRHRRKAFVSDLWMASVVKKLINAAVLSIQVLHWNRFPSRDKTAYTVRIVSVLTAVTLTAGLTIAGK